MREGDRGYREEEEEEIGVRGGGGGREGKSEKGRADLLLTLSWTVFFPLPVSTKIATMNRTRKARITNHENTQQHYDHQMTTRE